MIDKSELASFIEKELEGTDLYLVEISISADNQIKIELDSDSVVDIDECVRLSRAIEEKFNRDDEDYELEVGSAGITSPLRLPRQYQRHIGHELEIIVDGGSKLKGLLKSVGPDSIVVEHEVKIKEEGQKRPTLVKKEETINFGSIKQAKYLLKF